MHEWIIRLEQTKEVESTTADEKVEQYTLDKVEVHNTLGHLRLVIKEKIKTDTDFTLLVVHLYRCIFLYLHMLL